MRITQVIVLTRKSEKGVTTLTELRKVKHSYQLRKKVSILKIGNKKTKKVDKIK